MSRVKDELDDRSYSDLVEEGLALLPSIAPEWTNFNAADPGITFLELFAYFTEMLIFQTGQLTELDMQAFLLLLGADKNSSDTADREMSKTVLRLRQPERAVTCADYEALAVRSDARVARAKCVPRANLAEHNQAARRADRPGHVSLVVVAKSKQSDRDTKEMLDHVAAYLEPRRILTTRVHVVAARTVDFEVRLKVSAVPGAAAEATVTAARDALLRFLNPPSDGVNGLGWPPGKDVYLSDIYREVSRLATTDYVARSLDGKTGSRLDELVIGPRETDRLYRNSDGDLIGLRLAPDEIPGQITVSITGEAVRIDRLRGAP